jgi:hypothetical protein
MRRNGCAPSPTQTGTSVSALFLPPRAALDYTQACAAALEWLQSYNKDHP